MFTNNIYAKMNGNSYSIPLIGFLKGKKGLKDDMSRTDREIYYFLKSSTISQGHILLYLPLLKGI